MVKVFQLIKKYWNIILFLILELFCVKLIINSNNIQGADMLNSSNAIAGFFYEKQSQIANYFQMHSINETLLAENTKLNNELNAYKYFDTLTNVTAKIPLVTYDTLKSKVTDSTIALLDSTSSKPTIVQDLRPFGNPKIVKYASYNYIAAKVVNNSIVNDKNNYITINKGLVDGIKKDMAVVTADGVVGRVAYVSNHYAAIISVLSSRPISSQVAGGSIGVTNWTETSPDYVVMSQVDVRAAVRKGDTAYTTGYSNFPENIPIGVVASVDTHKVNNTLNLKLKLSNNFRKLKYVYVVSNKMGEERTQLENSVEQKEKEALKNNTVR